MIIFVHYSSIVMLILNRQCKLHPWFKKKTGKKCYLSYIKFTFRAFIQGEGHLLLEMFLPSYFLIKSEKDTDTFFPLQCSSKL